MTTWTTITNVSYYETLKEDAGEGETTWSINRGARAGDQVLLYVCAPVSAIVARAELSTAPWLDNDPTSEWFRTYFADMHGLRMLNHPLTRVALLHEFPDWGYWKQPRNSAKVPPEFELKLSDLQKQ